MDPRPNVAQAEPGTETVFAEQCVFTSIRSPLGRGYRIVAASAGIAADEKREIVQRAPSHASLCDTSPSGRGLASFVLQSERRCLLLAQNAGVEHSARGDYRVHTHGLILTPTDYRRLHCDPLHVEAAACAAWGDEWLHDQPAQFLAPLALDCGNATRQAKLADTPLPCAREIDGLASVLSAVLSQARVVVTGVPDGLRMLAWLWTAVPGTVRDALALSCGLRFSPGRSFPLICANTPAGEARRISSDCGYDVIDWTSPPGLVAREFERWVDFARRRWQVGQFARLDELAAGLTEEATPRELADIAALCDDIERLREASLAIVDELTARHAWGAPKTGAFARLRDELLRTADVRRDQLRQEEAAAAAAQNEPGPAVEGVKPAGPSAGQTPSSGAARPE